MDAGNVGLLKDDETRAGGKFEFNNFYKDIAIGMGLGLRLDLTYFVIWLDAAVPVRKPFIEGKDKWIFNDLSFVKDYILSLAIGYPF